VRIDLLLQRWIGILATLLLGWRETWRTRQALVVARDKDSFVVRRGETVDGAVVATLAPGAPASPEFVHSSQRRFITFALAAEEVAIQRISVPARAREFLAGIVRNQIERLSPWQADQVAYGFSAETNPKDAGTLDVRVLMASNAVVEAARAELAATGLTIDRMVVREHGPEAETPVVVWSRLDIATQQIAERARRSIAFGMIAAIGLSGGLAAWAQISAASIRSDSDEVAARSAALQRQLQGAHGGPSGVAHDPAERAWQLKEMTPSSVAILEVLSRTIPDNTYITELTLQNATVRIVGMTSDAPSLIAPLEQSGQFADVHFFAPTTRGPDGSSFVFHIEGRTTPHSAMPEK
jgi:general secretion pathway protein L